MNINTCSFTHSLPQVIIVLGWVHYLMSSLSYILVDNTAVSVTTRVMSVEHAIAPFIYQKDTLREGGYWIKIYMKFCLNLLRRNLDLRLLIILSKKLLLINYNIIMTLKITNIVVFLIKTICVSLEWRSKLEDLNQKCAAAVTLVITWKYR